MGTVTPVITDGCDKSCSELIEMLQKATDAAEDLVMFAEGDYDLSPELLHTIIKAKAILKELDQNAAIIAEVDSPKI